VDHGNVLGRTITVYDDDDASMRVSWGGGGEMGLWELV